LIANAQIVDYLDFLKSGLNPSINNSRDCSDENAELKSASVEDLAQTCMVELCGSPDINQTSALTNENVDKYLKNSDFEEFKPYEDKIKKLYSDIKKYSAYDKNKVILELEKATSTPTRAANFYRKGYNAHIKNFYKLSLDKSKQFPDNLVVGAAKSSKLNKSQQERVRKVISSQVKEMILGKSYYNKIEQKLPTEFLNELSLKIYSESRDIINSKYKNNEIILNKIQGDYKKIVENEATRQEVQAFISRIRNFSGKGTSQNTTDCLDKQCRQLVKEQHYSRVFEDEVEKIENRNIPSEKFILSHCMSHFASDKILSRQVKGVKDRFKKISKKYIENVLGDSSDMTKDLFKAFLSESVNLNTKTTTERQSLFLENIDVELDAFEKIKLSHENSLGNSGDIYKKINWINELHQDLRESICPRRERLNLSDAYL
jgi:hypothetical protein